MSDIVDREKDCPFLLRVFYRNGGHNSLNKFTIDSLPSEELSLYTWKNATLEELSQLIEQVIPEARDPDARIAFRLIYLDVDRGRYASKDLGRVVPASPTEDQKKTLQDCKFFIGDYLDVAIFIGPPPNALGKNNRSFGRRGGGNERRIGGNDRRLGDRAVGRLNDRLSGRKAPYSRDNNNRFGGRGQRRGDRF